VLSDLQWTQIRALAESLDPVQMAWVGGYFAGLAQDGLHPAKPAVDTASPAAGGSRRVTVLFGSETGNSAGVARELFERLSERGHPAALIDMADCKPKQLADAQDLLIVTSTYGDGEPPQPAISFFEWVEGRKAPRLDGARFAVLSLGDSTYEQFCAAGRRLDDRLQALGAARLIARVDCDVDYEEAAAKWVGHVLHTLAAPSAMDTAAGAAPAPAPVARTAPAGTYDKRRPFAARVIDNVVLTGRGSSKEVRHVELSLEGSNLRYEPGDALGLLPQNDPVLVRSILDLCGLDDDAPVELKGQPTKLCRALTTDLDIVNVTPRFLERWAQLSDAKELHHLGQADRATERTAFARTHHVVDVMRHFPVKRLDAAALAAALRPLQPRLYSIASSAAAVPGEVHLTVATAHYELHGQERRGVASHYLSVHGQPEKQVPVYVQAAPHFRLPADDVPIIMIGAGTGVAPYRAFVQEREARGAKGPSWLFFGERQFRTDFLYQTEWQGWLKDGALARMDVAFSRDAGHGAGKKTYVWHRLLERSRDVYRWLEQGAHLYVCGDAERMAPDVHRTLAEIVMQQAGRDADRAQEYLRELQAGHRYQRDVY
jgi:sulfite reductase (NADPH) flavoprotein alpha-component